MAKRRKLEAPTAEDLGRIEEEFRRETPQRGIAAPIAQVAAETADAFEPGTPEARRDQAQAAAYRKAEGQGHLIREIALGEIDPQALQRDRTVLDSEAMDELEHSIRRHGLRLPIELYAFDGPREGKRFGLLSGYRRFLAQQRLLSRTGDDAFARIKAVVRDPDQLGGAFVAMVEENEIRQDLSHYERGRIAAIAAQQGAFASTEVAVAEMFSAASKAKRSKIRSFAMIFEELGDLLRFPEEMKERDGLRLAQALRTGADGRLREVLGQGQGTDAASEWAEIEAVLAEKSASAPDPRRGGRPKAVATAADWLDADTLRTATGVTIHRGADGDARLLRLSGDGLSDNVVEALMLKIKDTLEKG